MGIQNIVYWDYGKRYKLNGTTRFLNIDSLIRNPINELLYKLIDTQSIIYKILDNIKIKIFIFKEEITNNIYFVFGPGIELFEIELYNKKINHIIYYIRSIIKMYVRNNRDQKIILCGHSFGCVLSQLVSLKLIKKEGEEFVKKHIWLLGSGSFRWLRPKDLELYERIMEGKYIIFGYGNEDYNNYYMSLINIRLLQTRMFVLRDGRESSEYENKVTERDIVRISKYLMPKKISAHKWETYLRELKKYFI